MFLAFNPEVKLKSISRECSSHHLTKYILTRKLFTINSWISVKIIWSIKYINKCCHALNVYLKLFKWLYNYNIDNLFDLLIGKQTTKNSTENCGIPFTFPVWTQWGLSVAFVVWLFHSVLPLVIFSCYVSFFLHHECRMMLRDVVVWTMILLLKH